MDWTFGTTMLMSMGLLAATVSDGGQVSYVQTRGGTRPTPRVAVDNVCAWPNLTTLADGTLVAVLFNKPSHGSMAGDVDCYASTDGGKTWEKRGTPAPHEPHTVRMNHAAGLATNGDLLVLCSGWTNVYPEGVKGRRFRASTLHPWVCRSSDGGRTWTVDKHKFPIKGPNGRKTRVWIPFGDILPGADGKLRATVYTSQYSGEYEAKRPKRADRVLVLRSPDDGRTWGEAVAVDPKQRRNETAMLHLGKGKWLLAARSNGLSLYASDDDAKTWTFRTQVTGGGCHPGHLLRLRDGKVLLTYGNRTKSRGIDVRWSADEGKTWAEPMRIVPFGGDGGYPASAQRADGQVVTVYYAQKMGNRNRYHMGVATWDPERTFAK